MPACRQGAKRGISEGEIICNKDMMKSVVLYSNKRNSL